MVEIDDKIVSEEIFDELFACDISKCKGICCIEGDSGAPLEIEEIDIIEENLDAIKPFMSDEGIKAIDEKGVFEVDSDGDYTTTLINGGECAFVTWQGDIALCAIEKAFRANKTTFKKPISCHLYPIRVKKSSNNTVGLNYHRWDVCRDACANGKKCGIKVYQGLQEPLERAFGKEFYAQLCEVDKIIESGDFDN